jgi:hypothetical protein
VADWYSVLWSWYYTEMCGYTPVGSQEVFPYTETWTKFLQWQREVKNSVLGNQEKPYWVLAAKEKVHYNQKAPPHRKPTLNYPFPSILPLMLPLLCFGFVLMVLWVWAQGLMLAIRCSITWAMSPAIFSLVTFCPGWPEPWSYFASHYSWDDSCVPPCLGFSVMMGSLSLFAQLTLNHNPSDQLRYEPPCPGFHFSVLIISLTACLVHLPWPVLTPAFLGYSFHLTLCWPSLLSRP